MKKIAAAVVVISTIVAVVVAAPQSKQLGDKFYIYTEKGDRQNHYIPAGWMGDFGDLKLRQDEASKPGAGKTCIKVSYSGERKQGAGWAGIYWQSPANNWGDKKGGFDLTGFKKLTFMARGEKGGEYIDKFMIGGITGSTEDGDSDDVSSDSIELTKNWQTYTIDLSKADLSHVIGGFGFALNSDSNVNGATFYLDEIVLTK